MPSGPPQCADNNTTTNNNNNNNIIISRQSNLQQGQPCSMKQKHTQINIHKSMHSETGPV